MRTFSLILPNNFLKFGMQLAKFGGKLHARVWCYITVNDMKWKELNVCLSLRTSNLQKLELLELYTFKVEMV